MANISSYTFTASDGIFLQDAGGWSKIFGITGDLRIRGNVLANTGVSGLGAAGYQCILGTPPSADYDVSCDLIVRTVIPNCFIGVAGRIQSGATTMYQVYHDGSANTWVISSRVSNTLTVLGSVSAGASDGNTYNIKLRMRGDQISGYVDGVLVLGPYTNTAITSAGLPGIRRLDNSNTSDSTGIHIDNFSADTIESGSTDGTADGATLTGTSSLFAGSASGGSVVDGTAAGATLTGTATLTAGNATGSASGSFVSDVLGNNTGSILANTAVIWEWRKGTGIGIAPTSVIYGSGTTSAAGVLTATGLPAGDGELLIATPDYVNVAYQRGTVA